MAMYRVVITATALRCIDALDGAEELIQSTFLAEGSGILAATEGAIVAFKKQYVTLMDLRITGFFVHESDDKPDDPLHVEFPIHLKELGS